MLNSNNPILRPGYLINAEDISKALHNIYQTGDLKVFNSVFYPIVDPFKFTPTYFQDVKDQYSSIDVNNLHDYNDIFNNINSGQNNIFIFNNSNRPGEHWFSIVVKKVGNEYIISYLNSLITENLVPEHIDTVKEICKKAHLASGGVERSGDDLFIIYSPNKLGQGENKVCGAVSTINAILIARDISIKDPDLVYYTEKSIQLLYSRIYFKLLESYEITPNELIGLMYHNPVMGIQNNLEHDIDINQFIIPQRLIQLQSIVQNVKETYLRDNPGDYLSDLALIQHHQNILDEENRLQAAQVADLSKSTLEANNAAFKDGSYFDIRKYMLDVSTKQYQFTLQLQQNAQAPVNNVVQPAPAPAPSAPELEDIIIVPEDMASSIVPSAPPLNDVQEAPPAPLAQPDENTNRSASEILPEQLKQHFPNLNNNINTSN
ncbi:MAG: hypothetical protein J0G32_00095, partial [Alphaproteobacteria bacterium]|nr:hypothetical protein [Alphaproteobacteria bacterium]